MFKPKVDRIQYGGAMIGKAEVNAVMKVIKAHGGTRWTVGPQSIALEKELAKVTGVARAVLTNSGSSALLIAVAALKLPKGSKVIIPAVNFPTAFNAILQNGLIPVVVDVELKTFNLDLLEVKKAINSHNISAVIAVNIAGNPVDLIKLRKLVGSKIKIILDDCDGYGTKLNGKFVETYADLACVSFHAAHIITMGEGGAVLTNDTKLADIALKMREWGRASGTDKIYNYPGFPPDYKERYVYEEIGYNMKPLELQCAMGRIQLRKLGKFVKARAKNYKALSKIFSKYPALTFATSINGADTCWFSFPILCIGVEREKVMRMLEENNIECRTIFSGNITKHPAYKDSIYECVGDLNNSNIVMAQGMFLSCHPSITKPMLKFIDKVISEIVK